MYKEGPGQKHCFLRRSVGVKKKDMFLGSNHLDHMRLTSFVFFCFLMFGLKSD